MRCDTFLIMYWYRLNSLQYDLGQQIRVEFEKAFSVKGTPVGLKSNFLCLVYCCIYLMSSMKPRPTYTMPA